jgi:hypothetical protein
MGHPCCGGLRHARSAAVSSLAHGAVSSTLPPTGCPRPHCYFVPLTDRPPRQIHRRSTTTPPSLPSISLCIALVLLCIIQPVIRTGRDPGEIPSRYSTQIAPPSLISAFGLVNTSIDLLRACYTRFWDVDSAVRGIANPYLLFICTAHLLYQYVHFWSWRHFDITCRKCHG